MKKHVALLLCILTFAFVLSGCSKDGQQTSSAGTAAESTTAPSTSEKQEETSASESESETETSETIKVEPGDFSPEGLTLYKSSVIPYLAEDGEVKLEVYTDAQKDDMGEFMWDDGQQFTVIATIGENKYTLAPLTNVQMGTMEFIGFENMTDESFCVIVKNLSGAGITMTEFTYQKGSELFEGRKIYEAVNINNVTDSAVLGE